MILSILINLLLLAVVYRMYGNIYDLKSDLTEEISRSQFWEKQFKNFSKDEAIEHERKLRMRFEKLYNELNNQRNGTNRQTN
jgi:predicted Holliday junction resolvase-like endonuclease